MQKLTSIDERQAGQSQQHRHIQESSYFDFLATQPLEFTETTDPLEANHWLHVTESKFKLLHCSEFQKTLFAAQQLCGSARHGGPRILPLFRTITKCHGMNSAQCFMSITFQQESCIPSCENSWIYSKGLMVCMSTLKNSTIWHSMVLIMLIPMTRRQSCLEED
jgi:hypothetical protein